jgi:glyoxylase-like metal-dependent hydrolase (beta-lactamase superfamily II)
VRWKASEIKTASVEAGALASANGGLACEASQRAGTFPRMNLEDHLGDIIRKARKAAQVSDEAAAAAAGLSTTELGELEKNGTSAKKPNLPALASKIGLDGKKLQEIAGGWTPSKQDLGTWRELRIVTTTANDMSVNAYVAWDEVSREAAVFDTGWSAQPLIDIIESNKLTLKHIFLTHSHEDHIAGLENLRAKYPKAHLHTSSKSAPPQHRNRANDFLQLGSLRITNRDTPGHAEDGVIYIIGNWPDDAPHVAIIGDTIFSGSMANGFISWDVLKQKVKEQILTLPGETLLCPGHGPLTTVGQEKAHNPFL